MKNYNSEKIERFRKEFYRPDLDLITMEINCRAGGLNVGKSTISRWIKKFIKDDVKVIEVPGPLVREVEELIRIYNENKGC